jgi:hypothetical protein
MRHGVRSRTYDLGNVHILCRIHEEAPPEDIEEDEEYSGS